MLSNDATIIKIKHEVYYQVAKLAFEGTFDEKKDDIPYNMIPGPKAKVLILQILILITLYR